jgi:hypothetical protein
MQRVQVQRASSNKYDRSEVAMLSIWQIVHRQPAASYPSFLLSSLLLCSVVTSDIAEAEIERASKPCLTEESSKHPNLDCSRRRQTTHSSRLLAMGEYRPLLAVVPSKWRIYHNSHLKYLNSGNISIRWLQQRIYPISHLSQVSPALLDTSALQLVLNVLTIAKSENLSLAANPRTPSSELNAYTRFVYGAATSNTVRCALILATLRGAQNKSHTRHA